MTQWRTIFFTNNNTVEHFPVIGLEKLYQNEFYIKKTFEEFVQSEIEHFTTYNYTYI